jgi:hypothetical protein
MNQGQAPNRPNRVRTKRHKKEDSSSDSDSASEDEDIAEINEEFNDEEEIESYILNDKVTTVNQENRTVEEFESKITLEELDKRIPQWGANIQYRNKKVYVSNTCTIDYFLLALWVLNKKKPNIFDIILDLNVRESIKNIIEAIEKLNWDKAREIWIVNVMKYDKNPIENTISMWGQLHDRFVQFLLNEQTHNLRQFCNQNCISNNQLVVEGEEILMFDNAKEGLQLHSFKSKKCKQCKKKAEFEFEFIHDPKYIFVESAHSTTFEKIPRALKLNTKTFRLLLTTLHKTNHFIGAFLLNDETFIVDDLKINSIKLSDFDSLNMRTRTEIHSYYTMQTGISMYYSY